MMFRWTSSGVMEPVGEYWAKKARERFVVGELYELDVHEHRSDESHRHYHAAIAEAHANLPDHLAVKIASPEHLRKWALVRARYRDERIITCSSPSEAQRFAALARQLDTFAVIMIEGTVVMIFTAKSQSKRAMGRKAFEESKTKVLDVIASIIGTTADALQRRGAEAA